MLKKAVWPWILIGILAGLPFLSLLGIGFYWLWQQHLLLYWLSLSASCSGIAWIIAHSLRKYQTKSKPGLKYKIAAIQKDSDLEETIWQEILIFAEQSKQNKSLDISKLDTWLQIGQNVLSMVAKQYRPKTKTPELDIPITDLLHIIEKISHDMHAQISTHVPFSHLLTVATGLNFQTELEHFNNVNTLIRLGRMFVNPLGGVINESKAYAQNKVLDIAVPHLQQWLIDIYIQQVTEYAILLYSGRLTKIDQQNLTVSTDTRQQTVRAEQHQEQQKVEPLRILIAGQINAGKSTLLNTLFDTPVAATDSVSCTPAVMPYKLERNNELSALIFDTPGYTEVSNCLTDNLHLLSKTDMLLLVCSANNAARKADKFFLTTWQNYFTMHPQLKEPPIIVVVTHIDKLRPFREWQPPYDWETPNNTKAQNIQAALYGLATDLNLPQDTPYIPLCLTEENYNLESLILAIGQHMDTAQRTRLLRIIKTSKESQKWPQLWQQLGNSGRWMLKRVDDLLP